MEVIYFPIFNTTNITMEVNKAEQKLVEAELGVSGAERLVAFPISETKLSPLFSAAICPIWFGQSTLLHLDVGLPFDSSKANALWNQ